MNNPATSLLQEIRQTRPFRSKGHEATLAILRTADLIRRRLMGVIEPHGVTMQQYNVLRILRGAGDEPLPTLEIADRMIEQTPGITRLLDRLEAKGLVVRERCPHDRRLVHCRITPDGLELLARMDDAVHEADDDIVAMLSGPELDQLIGLLNRVRERAR